MHGITVSQATTISDGHNLQTSRTTRLIMYLVAMHTHACITIMFLPHINNVQFKHTQNLMAFILKINVD